MKHAGIKRIRIDTEHIFTPPQGKRALETLKSAIFRI